MLRTICRKGGLRGPDGAAYHVQCWSVENGNVESVDYDDSNRPVRRVVVVHTDDHWAYSGPQRGMIECDSPHPSDTFISAAETH
jgi:hypothetical protein